MEDLNKNATTEKPIEVQKELKKEATGSSEINALKVAPKRIRVRTKTKPAPSPLAKNKSEAKAETIAPKVDPPNAKKPIVKKATETEVKTPNLKFPGKGKTETNPMNKKEVAIDLAQEKEKPDSLKVIKKHAKKAEEKVAKLKKKVKKAKKKGDKKELKEKLEKAIEKLKNSVKELKKAKK